MSKKPAFMAKLPSSLKHWAKKVQKKLQNYWKRKIFISGHIWRKAGNDDNLRNKRATAKYYTSKESSSKNLSFGAGYTLLSHWVPELRPYLSLQSIQISLQSRNLHLSHNLAPSDVYIYRKKHLSPNGIHPKKYHVKNIMCDDLLLQARYFAPHYFLGTMNSGSTFLSHLLWFFKLCCEI